RRRRRRDGRRAVGLGRGLGSRSVGAVGGGRPPAGTDEIHAVAGVRGRERVLLVGDRREVIAAATRRAHLPRRRGGRGRGRAVRAARGGDDGLDEIGLAHTADRLHAERGSDLGKLFAILPVQLGTV